MLDEQVAKAMKQIDLCTEVEIKKAKEIGLFVADVYKSLPKNGQDECLSVDDGMNRFYLMVKDSMTAIYSSSSSAQFNPKSIPGYALENVAQTSVMLGFVTRNPPTQSLCSPLKTYALTPAGENVISVLKKIDGKK